MHEEIKIRLHSGYGS